MNAIAAAAASGSVASVVASRSDKDSDEDSGREGLGVMDSQMSGQLFLEMADMWSIGSSLHSSEGKCRPCHYVHTTVGCLNGRDCEFCHLPHTKKSRPRPCKTKRLQCKRIVNVLEQAALSNE